MCTCILVRRFFPLILEIDNLLYLYPTKNIISMNMPILSIYDKNGNLFILYRCAISITVTINQLNITGLCSSSIGPCNKFKI